MKLIKHNYWYDEKSENDFRKSQYDIANAKLFYLVSIFVIFILFII